MFEECKVKTTTLFIVVIFMAVKRCFHGIITPLSLNWGQNELHLQFGI